MKRIYIISLLLSFTLLHTNCSSDNDDFVGVDSAIALFKLTKEGKDYIGSIKDNTVTITLPENQSLDKAIATVVVSENAKMIPDPTAISNWDEEFRFSIKSYNGESTIYTYTPVFTPIKSETGDIHLATQKDVDEFATRTNIPSIIDGNLIIGKVTGDGEDDRITNISALSGITEIRNNLVLNQTFLIEDVYNFVKLEKIGGLEIKATQNIKNIEFEKLTTVNGNIAITSPSLQTISLSKLKKVSGTFTLAPNTISKIDLTTLETVGGDISFTNGNNATIQKLSLPNLKVVKGKFTLSSFTSIKACDFSKLEECGNGIDFSSLNALTELEFKALKTTKGSLRVTNSGMAILSFPALKDIQNLEISNLGTLSTLKLDELETVSGTFNFQAWRSPFVTKLMLPKLRSVGASVDLMTTFGANYYTIEEIHMPKLEEIGGTLKISVGFKPSPNTSLKVLDFSSLTKVGNITIFSQSLLSDFSSFKNLIPNIKEEQWSIEGCAHNPTYEEMK